MEKETTEGTTESTPTWATLETFARKGIQELLQRILEEEVTELLGREKSERKSPVDARGGYRNGYGKPRRLSMLAGTIGVRRPRVRGLDSRFESRILPLFKRRTEQIGELLPDNRRSRHSAMGGEGAQGDSPSLRDTDEIQLANPAETHDHFCFQFFIL